MLGTIYKSSVLVFKILARGAKYIASQIAWLSYSRNHCEHSFYWYFNRYLRKQRKGRPKVNKMKMFLILMILGVAAVFALPVEEKSETEKPETLTLIELEPEENETGQANDEFIRDKRRGK